LVIAIDDSKNKRSQQQQYRLLISPICEAAGQKKKKTKPKQTKKLANKYRHVGLR